MDAASGLIQLETTAGALSLSPGSFHAPPKGNNRSLNADINQTYCAIVGHCSAKELHQKAALILKELIIRLRISSTGGTVHEARCVPLRSIRPG